MKFLEEDFPEHCNSCGAEYNIWLIQFTATDAEEPLDTPEKFIGPWCEKCIATMDLLTSIEIEDMTLIEIEHILFLIRIKEADHMTKCMEEALEILQQCHF